MISRGSFPAGARVALAVFVLSGCGVTHDQMRLEIGRLQNEIGDMRSLQADHANQLSLLRNEILRLTGRIEETEYSTKNELGSNLQNLKQDISSLKKRVPPPAIVPVNTLTADEDFAATLSPELGRDYAEGLSLVRDGRFRDAVPALNRAQAVVGNADWGAMLYFWLGVAFEGAADNRAALQAYHAVSTQFPKSKRVPLALLRQGSVLVRLGDSAAAKLVWNKLISEHGKTDEARLAKDRLKGL